MSTFHGFSPEVQSWFRGLEADNSRSYFTANRDFFEDSIRDQMAALLSELAGKLGGEMKLFRQNRDVRFSADKSPYKTNTYGVISGSELGTHLYASISASGLVAGSGYYMLDRDGLERFREALDQERSGAELEKAVAKAQRAGLELWGETLATAPRGYSKDHPRIELLRRKNLALGARLEFGDGIARSQGLGFVSKTWQSAAPVTRWLEAHVGAARSR